MRSARYALKRPCANCPFTRDEGAVRLMPGRIEELAEVALGNPGGTFPCHQTVNYNGPRKPSSESECAGALIFAEKQGRATQMTRIAMRLGMVDPSQLEGQDRVFDSVDEMLATAIGRQGDDDAE